MARSCLLPRDAIRRTPSRRWPNASPRTFRSLSVETEGKEYRMSKPKAQSEPTFGSSYQGSTFKEVRDQVFSDPYKVLPQLRVTFRSFFRGFTNVLFKAAQRA